MRDPRIGLLILGIGLGSALVKKSKPLARYMGDQFIRAGEYLKTGSDEPDQPVSVQTVTSEPAPAEEYPVEAPIEASFEEETPVHTTEVVPEEIAEALPVEPPPVVAEPEMVTETSESEPVDDKGESSTDQSVSEESGKAWDQ